MQRIQRFMTRQNDLFKMIMNPLLLLIIQFGFLVCIFLTCRPDFDGFLVDCGLIAVMCLFNGALIVRKMMLRKKEILTERVREQLFVSRLNDQRRLVEKQKLDDMVKVKRSLKVKIDLLQAAVQTMKGGGCGPCIEELLLLPGKEDDAEVFCRNALTNVILRNKSVECKENNILFVVGADVPINLKIAGCDLCSIFSNLIDNAIEACKEVTEGERRICVQVKPYGCYLYIEVENTSTLEHAKRPYREDHGLGMTIVKRIVKNYCGDFSAEFADGQYLTEVTLKVG